MKTVVIQRVLPCYLTPEELQTESQVLVGLLQKKSSLEDEKRSTNSMYTERIKTVEERIEAQMPIVQYGRVDRLVDIKLEYHTPEEGMKRLTRLDTQAVIEIAPMTDDELQNLFINAGELAEGEQADVSGAAPEEEPAEDTPEEIIDYIPEEQVSDFICEPGKLYRFRGIIGRCKVIAQFETGCDKCAFKDNCPADTEPVNWDCDTNNVTFVHYPVDQADDCSTEET